MKIEVLNSFRELDRTDIEGVVVRFDDGHMVKIKLDLYCAIHKAKENILQEKNVVKLILEEKVDDILPNLPEVDKKRLEEYKEELVDVIDYHSDMIGTHLRWLVQTHTKKEFALEYANQVTPMYRSIIFSCWDRNSGVREEVVKFILKNCSSQTKLDEIRYTLPEKW